MMNFIFGGYCVQKVFDFMPFMRAVLCERVFGKEGGLGADD